MITKLTMSIALAAVAIGCNKDKSDDKPDKPETAAPATKAAAAEAIMTAYEACRTRLAADDGAVAGCAADIEKAARAGEATLGEPARAMAAAAGAMAKMPAGDIAKLRVQFGEVSRPLEKLLTTVPEVAADYRMYECSMAEGFNRWAERSSGADHTKANPYMGTKMSTCGTEVHGHHGGAMLHGGAMHHDGGAQMDLMAAETAAHQAAAEVLEDHCAKCHDPAKAKSKKAKKAVEHFAMGSYPYGGHHAADLGKKIREVLGVEGGETKMPKDDPGSVKGEDLDKIVAWTKAWDAAAAAMVGHHANMGDHHDGDGDGDGDHHDMGGHGH